MKTFVIISDTGLNGFIIHAVRLTQPSKAEVDACGDVAGRYTGYSGTVVEEFDAV